MIRLIGPDRSIIPACDFDSIKKFEEILRETSIFTKVGAYKIGATLALTYGLPKLVDTARKYTDKPLIYDHQKAGTDIPETGKAFMRMLKSSGINSIIIFPLSGPTTQKAWIEAASEEGLHLICGGHMTHKTFIASEGGYIADDAVEKIYINASNNSINDFVVPGNKPDVIMNIRNILEAKDVKPIFYSPGFISQGGVISDAAGAAGSQWHAIIGRAIYESTDISKSVQELISKI
jgi:orotidine-5'-phosphate decarboxylase